MPHSKKKLLEDVLIAIRNIESFSKGKTFDDYKSDKLLQSAIERQLEIIGEALYRLRALDESYLNSITDAHRIIGMRNILAHGYDVINDQIAWEVVESHIPILKAEITESKS